MALISEVVDAAVYRDVNGSIDPDSEPETRRGRWIQNCHRTRFSVSNNKCETRSRTLIIYGMGPGSGPYPSSSREWYKKKNLILIKDFRKLR